MTARMFWATMLATTCLLPGALQADAPLPTDANVISGDITISNPTASQMLLQQASTYGIVDWGSFSIANGFGVQFQNGSGATLNRVTGSDLSAIFGTLDATGSVYLINRNGVVFGASGVVNTGGSFVASTLDIDNADFLDGGDNTFAGESAAYVINLGAISSLGGDVAILARNVVNDGTLTAPNGTVGLAAGREILMRDASVADGMFAVRIGGPDTSVSESGAIRAAAAELRANGGNVYALAGNTRGTIAATGVARVKGRVFLTAGDGGHVKVAKTVKATEADGSGGTIAVDGGQVEMSGLLDVSGTAGGAVRITSNVATVFSGAILAYGTGAPDTGGFVEVSGAHLTFGGTVDTGGGTVLIDPDNIEITDFSALLLNASVLTTASITDLLLTSDVIIQTGGASGEAGTIAISSSLSWATPFSLSLLAHGDILAFASIQGGDLTGGDVNLVAGWDGTTGASGFDAAVFDGAALASQSLFGQNTGAAYSYNGVSNDASGSVFIGDGNRFIGGGLFAGVAVGALSGATRVYARDLVLAGSSNPDGSFGFAMLGYNANGFGAGFSLDGAISVRATGDISLIAGPSNNAAAQIGHIGVDPAALGTLVGSTAPITIEGLGNLTLQAGASSGGAAYAMVGNGSLNRFTLGQTSGTRSGDITVNVGGEISLQDQPSTGDEAWIGHSSATFNAVSNADIFLTAAAFDLDVGSSVGSGGTGTLDISMVAADLLGGNFTATATDSSLNLIGTTSFINCECASINTTNNLVVQASNDLLLDASFAFSNTSGGKVALAAGANFHNNSGADAFGAMRGRWLIYSTRPDQNTGDVGVLGARFIDYQVTYDPANPFGAAFAGKGLIYAVNPVITIGDATMTYGGALVPPSVDLRVDGVVVDAAAFGMALGAVFIDGTKITLSTSGLINAGAFADALVTSVSVIPPTVALISRFSLDAGQLTVDRAILTAAIIGTPTKVYDGTDIATLSAANFLLSGFVASEGASVTRTAGTYATANANPSGPVSVSATLAATDFTAIAGTDLANYALPTIAAGDGAISQALITGTIVGDPTKVYDGNDIATLTAANFLLSGFVSGEGATVGVTSGTYATANASVTNAVAVTLGADDFVATGSTLLSNYTLPSAVTGNGAITQATLGATIVGAPTKVYDGNATATLTAANFLLSGFVAGQGATVSATLGTYASANASASNAVTAALASGDFAATGATNLANYILPASATGAGVISQAALTGSIIGTPTKIYDGTNIATLTSANFLLAGFVTGEGATVSATAGTYVTANASTENQVTVTLAAGDLTATGSTLMSNYVLPFTVSGTGAIDRALLSAAIVGLPTKPFDGTATAILTAANFSLVGFVAGEGATVTQTVGTYASASSGAANTVNASLAATDFSATSGTLLANYILPTAASGPGLIGTAPSAQPPIPRSIRVEPFDTTPLGVPSGPATGIEVINAETTQRILDEIRAGTAFCKALVRQEYVIDCLSDRLQSVADGLSAVGEYSEVRSALEDAAQQLHALVLANASDELAQQVARVGGRRSSRALTPIATEAMGAVNAQAAVIIEGAELVLLRSSSGSERRAVAFSQVAQVVNSTKVLLRSS